MQTIEEFRQECIDLFAKQENFAYFGDIPEWGQVAFIGTHRDAETLTRSNWQVVTEDLLEKHPDSFRIESSSHWAVGWVEVLRIDTRDEKALVAAMDWRYELDQYPVANEEHWSEMEHEEDQEYYRNGGKDDALEILFQSGEFDDLFDEDQELKPEFEDYVNYAFHGAMGEGDHTAIPEESMLEHMGYAIAEKAEDDRREYERYQPPVDGLEV